MNRHTFPDGLALRWCFAKGHDTRGPQLAIELLQAIVPNLRRLVVFIGIARREAMERFEEAAWSAGLDVRFEVGHGLDGIEKVLAALEQPRKEAMLLFDLPVSDTIGPDVEQQVKKALASLAEITVRHRIASLYPDRLFVDAGDSMIPFELTSLLGGRTADHLGISTPEKT